MKNKILIIVLIIQSPFTSCTYNYVSLLSEKDLEWMEAYNDGDSVLLNLGYIVFLIIVDREFMRIVFFTMIINLNVSSSLRMSIKR